MMHTTKIDKKSYTLTREKNPEAGLLYRIITEYKPTLGSEMFLSYISFRNKFIINRPPKFTTSKFVINLDEKCFRATLNREPIYPGKINKRNVVVSYQGVKLPIENVEYNKDSLQILVYPDSTDQSVQKQLKEIFTKNDDKSIANLEYKFNGIQDSLGNELDLRNPEHMQQFREFFVQEVRIGPQTEPSADEIMKNNLPLFSSLQPLFGDAIENNYWMNTPLPPIKD